MFHLAPAPREGETLYSVMARLCRYLDAPSAAVFQSAFTANRHTIASVGLPGRLTSLLSDVPQDVRLAAINMVIDRLTLFPFHTAYHPSEIREGVRAAMHGDTSGIFTKLGLATFKVRPPDRLRFCSLCIDDMERGFEDLWWRREHQLPGAMVCFRHGSVLHLSGVDTGGKNRHSFIPATRDNCPRDAPAVIDGDITDDTKAALLSVAQQLASLLDHPPTALSFNQRAACYRDQVTRTDLMLTRARIDLDKLHVEFQIFWRAVLDLVPGIALSDDTERTWLTAMVRSGRRAAPPIQHVMLRLFLDQKAESNCDLPFGAGPWSCRNPVVDHFGKTVIDHVAIRSDRTMIYGDFVCKCGYKYTVTRSPDGALSRPRYREFGPLFAPALSEAIKRGDSLRSTARRLGMDPKTLAREADSAGITVPWRTKPSGRPRSQRLPDTRPKTGPSCQRTAQRKRDWLSIDARLCRSVETAAGQIRAERPPMRVTFAELERRISRRDWLTKRKWKLPCTIETVRTFTENVDEFRERRLEYRLRRAALAGDMRACGVLRDAGLPSSWLPRVKQAICEFQLGGRLAA
jgi:hypothetical protein